MHSHDGKADIGADEELLFVGLEHVQRLFVGKIRVIDDVDAVANTHFDGFGTARVSIHPPAMGMDGLGHRGDLGFGHQGVRVPAVGHPDVAGDHHLDTVDAFADQLARDPAKLVRPVRDQPKGFEERLRTMVDPRNGQRRSWRKGGWLKGIRESKTGAERRVEQA